MNEIYIVLNNFLVKKNLRIKSHNLSYWRINILKVGCAERFPIGGWDKGEEILDDETGLQLMIAVA